MLSVRAQDNADVSRLNPAGKAVNAVGELTAVIRSGAHLDDEDARAHLSERSLRAASMLSGSISTPSTWLALSETTYIDASRRNARKLPVWKRSGQPKPRWRIKPLPSPMLLSLTLQRRCCRVLELEQVSNFEQTNSQIVSTILQWVRPEICGDRQDGLGDWLG
jgi:hypothetical protein